MVSAIFEFIGNVIGFVGKAVGVVLIIALILQAFSGMNEWSWGLKVCFLIIPLIFIISNVCF